MFPSARQTHAVTNAHKTMTKLIATIMSVLLVLFTGYGLSQSPVFANAEESEPEAVLAAPEEPSAEHDLTLAESDGEPAAVDDNPAPDASPSTLTLSSSSSQLAPGSSFTLRLTQSNIGFAPGTTDGKLSELSMTMTGLPTALDITGVKALSGTTVIYDSSLSSNANGEWKREASGHGGTLEFSSDYLDSMAYGTSTPYVLELSVTVPDDKSDLLNYKDSDSGNAVISLSGVKGNVDGTYAAGGTLDSDASFDSGSAVTVLMPKLSAIMTMDPSKVQVFGTIRYNVTITSLNAAAKQIVIRDVETDALAQLGVVPTGTPSVSIDGAEVELSSTAMTVSNGNITITLPADVSIPTSTSLVVSYSMKIGTDELKEQGKLSELLALDTANRTRHVTVTAGNAFESVEADAAFTIIAPSVSATITTSNGDSPTLTTSGKLQVTSTFNVLGDEGAVLVNPTLNVAVPPIGTIDNIKVNGTPYNRGDILPSVNPIILTYDVIAPSDYEPDYNKTGIAAAATLKADNLINNVTSSVTVKLAIPETSISLEASPTTPSATSTGASNDGIVHVKATVSEISGASALSGYQLSVAEALPASEGEPIDPASARFQDVKINGELANESDYSVSGNVLTLKAARLDANASIVVEYDDYMKSGYEQNGAVCNVSANVQAAAGFENANFPSNQAKTATTSYTVQTPLLHIAQEVTGPVTEVPADSAAATTSGSASKSARDADTSDENNGSGDGGDGSGDADPDNPLSPDNPDVPNLPTVSLVPDVINVGDTVSYKTTFYEDNPDMPSAIGRNFALKVSIDDLVIGDTASDADASAKRTYKASQLGITFNPVSEVKLVSGESDVTESFDVELNSDKTELSIAPKDGTSQDCPSVPTSVEFSVKMGAAEDQNNFDQLAGNEITVRATASVSNLEKSVSSVSTTTIADAKLSLAMSVSNNEIGHGMRNTYTITAMNDKEGEFSDSSKARNVHIENGLDDSAKTFGYKIDPSSLNVMLDGKDITSTSDVAVKWADGNSGFDMVLSRDLPKDQELVVTYEATTDGIDAQAYSETLGDVAIATADNSKPAVAYANILYTGADFQDNYGAGAGAGADGAAGGTIGALGDIIVYVIGSVAALAIIGIVGVIIWRRRR